MSRIWWTPVLKTTPKAPVPRKTPGWPFVVTQHDATFLRINKIAR